MTEKQETWKIVREADDPIALRLSIGGIEGELGYIVYRGETEDCVKLLRKALDKFETHLKEQGE
jgi:hypothetical protein